MNLVFKDKNQSGDDNAPILYRDAIVNDGTLTCLDFSNRGMLTDYDLNRGVVDLADGVVIREENNITTNPVFGISQDAVIPVITDRRGLPMTFIGDQAVRFQTGVQVKGVGKYLYDNKPRSLMLVWLSIDTTLSDLVAGRIVQGTTSAGGNELNIMVHIPTPTQPQLSIRFATKISLANYLIPNNVPTQVAIEYISDSVANRVFINGEFVDNGITSAGTFGNPANDDIMVISPQVDNVSLRNPADLYHFSVHDLDVSGKTADDLVAMNYEYVNGIGRYEGLPTRRPYANLPVAP